MHQKVSSLEAKDGAFYEVVDINLNSVFALTREVLKVMVPRGKGSVINISSMAALYGLPLIAAYSSSKAALLGLTRSLAAEFSYSGIRINAIAPGFIESEMLRNVMENDPERKQKVLGRTPMRRLGPPTRLVTPPFSWLPTHHNSLTVSVCRLMAEIPSAFKTDLKLKYVKNQKTTAECLPLNFSDWIQYRDRQCYGHVEGRRQFRVGTSLGSACQLCHHVLSYCAVQPLHHGYR